MASTTNSTSSLLSVLLNESSKQQQEQIDELKDKERLVTLKELEECLAVVKIELNKRSEQLKDFVKDHSSEFDEYLERLVRAEKVWKSLERKSIELSLYGSSKTVAIQQSSKLLTDSISHQSSNDEDDLFKDYLKYVEDWIYEMADRLAKIPSYDSTKASVNSTIGPLDVCTISLVVSKKTFDFVEAIKQVIEEEAGTKAIPSSSSSSSFSSIILAGIKFYVDQFELTFAMQLQQLPHLACLFYNDCHFLTLFATREMEEEEEEKGEEMYKVQKVYDFSRELEERGSRILQRIIDNQKADIENFCSDELFRPTLDVTLLKDIQKSLVQVKTRLIQLNKIFINILDSSLTFDIISSMVEIVIKWAWENIVSIKRIDRDAIRELAELSNSVAQLLTEIFGSKAMNLRKANQYGKKFDALVRICGMTLIQLSNAFRREEFHSVLTMAELESIVGFLFVDSAMKSAFIAEIDAEN